MKKLLFLLLSFSMLLLSCREEPSDLQRYTNNWVFERMQYNYYWNEELPSNPNMELDTKGFFEALLYKYRRADGDRFSWIEPNYKELMKSLKGVSVGDVGFRYLPKWANEKKTEVIFEILYVKKNSDAEKKGLKRGEIVIKVDGVDITEQNYQSVFSNKNQISLTVFSQNEMETSREVEVDIMKDFAEDPIFLSKVIDGGAGKKIGYLVYNLFTPDKGDGSSAYDKRLIEEFSMYKNEGVNEFILDLRYNSGGAVSSCMLLSSLLRNSERKPTDVFCYIKTNKRINENEKAFFMDKYVTRKGNSLSFPLPLDLNRVFVLTGKRTASASEMVINGLLPYAEVIQIGDTTVGKNVGSYTVYDVLNPENTWGLQPITLKIFNSEKKSDYSGGFIPQVANLVNEFKYPLVDFGNFSDPLLARALEIIGVSVPASTEAVNRRKKAIRRSMSLGEPVRSRPLKDNWQESEMQYPMYIERDPSSF